ncbi:MAG: DUF4923 family protein [bacterium]|jgi:hypothetical protein|nr:DUF4923 family protein [bacterium]
MKRLLLNFAMTSLLLAAAPAASASPDITDLLKGAASKIGGGDGSTALSGLKGAVEGMIAKSDLTAADLVGDYKYSAPAVSLQSDNALQKLGGSAATGVIVDKLAPYYQKAGLTSMTATFREDGTCEFKVKKATVTGTYERNESGDFTFNFKAVKKIPLGKMNAHVEKIGKKLTLTFDASKLIKLVNAVASVSGQSSLQAAAKMLNSYDGLYAGFELTPAE